MWEQRPAVSVFLMESTFNYLQIYFYDSRGPSNSQVKAEFNPFYLRLFQKSLFFQNAEKTQPGVKKSSYYEIWEVVW